jgi:hypothetical protein
LCAALLGGAPARAAQGPAGPYVGPEPISDFEYRGREYNLKVGPVYLRADIKASNEFSDNVFYSARKAESDFIFRITPRAEFFVPIDPQNELRFGVAVEHQDAMEHSDNFDRTNPRFDLAYHYEDEKWRVDAMERFVRSSDPLWDPLFTGFAVVDRTRNIAGGEAARKFGKVQWFVRGYHTVTEYDDRDFEDFNRTSVDLGTGARVTWESGYSAGVVYLHSDTLFDTDTRYDLEGHSGRAFWEGPVTRNTSFLLEGGYAVTQETPKTAGLSERSVARPIWTVELRNQLSESTEHRLGAYGRPYGSEFGTYADIIEVRYLVEHQLNKKLRLALGFSYEHVNDRNVDEEVQQEVDRYMMQVGGEYLLTKFLRLGLSYRHVIRTSSRPDGDYDENRVRLDLRYVF